MLSRLLFILCVVIPTYSYSQKTNQSGLRGGVDFQIGIKNGSLNPSITYYELISIVKNKSLFIGWTGRLGALYGNNLDYYTAPARLTRGQSGLGSLVKPLLSQNIDTIRFDRISQTSINVGIRAEFYSGRITIGGSLDLLGLTFLGRSRIGLIRSSTGFFTLKDSLDREISKTFQGEDAYQQATPHRLNIRLLGDNNQGMLTTEVYTRVRINEDVSLKVGYQWLTTEMAIKNMDIMSGNNRFRNRVGLLCFGLTVPISPW